MQASASITYWSSPADIASTGHSASQAPHEIQELSITYAIVKSSFNFYTALLYQKIRVITME
jgi:hypothetical protein